MSEIAFTTESAFAHLEAYINGGDELGDVPDDDAIAALDFLRDENERLRAALNDANQRVEKQYIDMALKDENAVYSAMQRGIIAWPKCLHYEWETEGPIADLRAALNTSKNEVERVTRINELAIEGLVKQYTDIRAALEAANADAERLHRALVFANETIARELGYINHERIDAMDAHRARMEATK